MHACGARVWWWRTLQVHSGPGLFLRRVTQFTHSVHRDSVADSIALKREACAVQMAPRSHSEEAEAGGDIAVGAQQQRVEPQAMKHKDGADITDNGALWSLPLERWAGEAVGGWWLRAVTLHACLTCMTASAHQSRGPTNQQTL